MKIGDDIVLLKCVSPVINDFAKRVPLVIEMGRFIIANCGPYFTSVKKGVVLSLKKDLAPDTKDLPQYDLPPFGDPNPK